MRAFLATPELCLPPAALPHRPRRVIEAAVERLIAELDRFDALPLPVSNLFALEGHRHVA